MYKISAYETLFIFYIQRVQGAKCYCLNYIISLYLFTVEHLMPSVKSRAMIDLYSSIIYPWLKHTTLKF